MDELGAQEALILGRSVAPSAHPGGGVGSGTMKKLFNRRTSIAKSDNERMIFFHDIKEVVVVVTSKNHSFSSYMQMYAGAR